MNAREISQQERLGRVVTFADGHASDFPAGKPAAANVAIVRDVLTQLDELGGTQTGSAGQAISATGRKNALLDEVRADLIGLARVARELHDEKPELENEFKLPTDRRDETLLNAARAQLDLLTDATQGAALVALFVDYGMADDFVADLQADIAAAAVAASAQDEHSGARREDTLAIDAQIELGIRAVGKLDAYCGNKYRDDAVLLGAWKSASHLELRRVHPRESPAKS